jgi:hypothetical protein
MAFECLNQSLSNLVCIAWHLSPSQWYTSWISPIGMCIPSVVARQWLGIYVPVATNTWTKEELLDTLLSAQSVSYQTITFGTVCASLYFCKAVAR